MPASGKHAIRPRRLATLSAIFWFATIPNRAHAWGSVGHEIIAAVAEARLTPRARAAVTKLLAGDPRGASLAAVSTWADEIRLPGPNGRPAERPCTGPWHFIDTPVEHAAVDPDRECRRPASGCPPTPGGDCVVAATERELRRLTDAHASNAERAAALKFVVHFIGDLHQPLHCAERNHDRGGNDVPVTFFGERTAPTGEPWNLHSVWDAGLIFRAQPTGSVRAYGARLNRWLSPHDEARLRAGSIIDWANDTHAVARTHAYAGVPLSGGDLGREYFDANIEVLNAQLAKAGVRLARVLNDAFP